MPQQGLTSSLIPDGPDQQTAFVLLSESPLNNNRGNPGPCPASTLCPSPCLTISNLIYPSGSNGRRGYAAGLYLTMATPRWSCVKTCSPWPREDVICGKQLCISPVKQFTVVNNPREAQRTCCALPATEWMRPAVPSSSWRESNLDGPSPAPTPKKVAP